MPHIASERLYVTPDGRVLREAEMDENTVAVLLVGEGGALSDADARRLGLKADKPAADAVPPDLDADTKADTKAVADADTKAIDAAPHNKARRPSIDK